MTRLVLLPGMDGTGELFDPFIAALHGIISTSVVRYPAHLARYEALTAWVVAPRIQHAPAATLPRPAPSTLRLHAQPPHKHVPQMPTVPAPGFPRYRTAV